MTDIAQDDDDAVDVESFDLNEAQMSEKGSSGEMEQEGDTNFSREDNEDDERVSTNGQLSENEYEVNICEEEDGGEEEGGEVEDMEDEDVEDDVEPNEDLEEDYENEEDEEEEEEEGDVEDYGQDDDDDDGVEHNYDNDIDLTGISSYANVSGFDALEGMDDFDRTTEHNMSEELSQATLNLMADLENDMSNDYYS